MSSTALPPSDMAHDDSKPNELLSIYLRIEAVTSQMLTAAKSANWQLLVQLSERYHSTVQDLKALESTKPKDEMQRQSMHELLLKILDNDAKVRDLVHPELARLNRLMQGASKQKEAINKYYGTLGNKST